MKLIDLNSYNDRQKLVFFVVALLVLILITYIAFSVAKSVDYSKVQPSDYILKYEIQTDRKTYWILEDIISNYIYSSRYNETDENNVSYVEYYEAFDSEYQKYLGKSKYLKLAESFFEKFRVEQSLEGSESSIKITNLIESYYKDPSNSSRYICRLNTAKSDEFAYIGISLNTSKKTYTIFYLN